MNLQLLENITPHERDNPQEEVINNKELEDDLFRALSSSRLLFNT